MKIAAIISEYNPFHKGHDYQINETRSKAGATHIIAIMSGNFVQRGYPAIIDKYRRAEMAMLGGADLVLELPTVFATASAEHFAQGAIRILNSLNGVQLLSFGTETGNLINLWPIASLLAEEPLAFKTHLKENLSKGMSFPKARNLAITAMSPIDDLEFLSTPNNILAIEYLKALIQTNSKIEPYTLMRVDSGYHNLDLAPGKFASASAIRRGIFGHEDLIDYFPNHIQPYFNTLLDENYDFVQEEDFRELLLYKLISDPKGLKDITDASEGLDQRIYQHMDVLAQKGVVSFIDSIKTRRYSHTRISRILIQFLLSLTNEDTSHLLQSTPPSVKILGLNEKGREILAHLRKDQTITLQHNFKKKLDDFQTIDVRASRIYGLKNKSYDDSWDFMGYKP